eukprot:GHVR01151800.1.p1 GENE.GHVR01151800.1~~GHVR01151800.1.p1  ORF type:complete len:107 (+),score=8.97 GHVR01151800.1:2001-2321(+)
MHGHLELVKFFIGKGANVNARDNNRVTPLIWASEEGHLDVVKFLIEKGAEINDRDLVCFIYDDNTWLCSRLYIFRVYASSECHCIHDFNVSAYLILVLSCTQTQSG